MKKIVLKLYEFDELSKDSQERIIERERWNVMEQCMDAYNVDYKKSMEWLPCPRCGLRPLVWEFDNGRATACGCGTDCYSHWSVQAESIMSVIKRSDNGKSAEAYDIDELKNNWNHWVRTGEILFTPGNGRW